MTELFIGALMTSYGIIVFIEWVMSELEKTQ